MRQALLYEYKNLDSLVIETVPIPEPPLDHVLIKVKYAAMKSRDLFIIQGMSNFGQHTPVRLGMEACGEVVKSGGGEFADALLGKRVAFAGFDEGYVEYRVFPAKGLIFPLRDEISYKDAAGIVGNPMSTLSLVDIMKRKGYQGIIINAAGSAVARILMKLCKKEGIKVVGLVRKEPHVELILGRGATYAFNVSQEGWFEQAKQACREANVSMGLDSVGGIATGQLLNLVQDHGVVYTFGKLANEDCIVSGEALAIHFKSLKGFGFKFWLEEQPLNKKDELAEIVMNNLEDFIVQDAEVVPLSNLKTAYEEYAADMTGKHYVIQIEE